MLVRMQRERHYASNYAGAALVHEYDSATQCGTIAITALAYDVLITCSHRVQHQCLLLLLVLLPVPLFTTTSTSILHVIAMAL
jgi:hypothetical protein